MDPVGWSIPSSLAYWEIAVATKLLSKNPVAEVLKSEDIYFIVSVSGSTLLNVFWAMQRCQTGAGPRRQIMCDDFMFLSNCLHF